MYQLVASTRFLDDLKLLKKRSIKDFQLLQDLIAVLAQTGHSGLGTKHKAHNFLAIMQDIGSAMSNLICYLTGAKMNKYNFWNW